MEDQFADWPSCWLPAISHLCTLFLEAVHLLSLLLNGGSVLRLGNVSTRYKAQAAVWHHPAWSYRMVQEMIPCTHWESFKHLDFDWLEHVGSIPAIFSPSRCDQCNFEIYLQPPPQPIYLWVPVPSNAKIARFHVASCSRHSDATSG